MQRFRRTTVAAQTGVVALVTAVLVYLTASLVLAPRSTAPLQPSPSGGVQGIELTSVNCNPTTPPAFSVCGPAAGSGPVLYPGAPASTLPLTFYNGDNVDLFVTSLKVAFTNTFPPHCDATKLMLSGPGATVTGTAPTFTFTFSSLVDIPAGTASNPGTKVYKASLQLQDSGDQDACAGLQLAMSYTAQAQFTASTTSALAASPSPSAVGSGFTLTATVSTATSGATTPAGSVTFYACTTSSASTCTTPLGPPVPLNGSGAASVAVPVVNTPGTYYYDAVYAPADSTNFSVSTSAVLAQVVQGATCVTISTASSPNLTTITGTYSGNYEVKSGATLWLKGGTITGNVTVDAGGKFVTSAGTVGGNVQASGGAVALQGTHVGGNVQTQNAALGLGPNTTVGGNVQAQSSGTTALCASGMNGAVVTIGKNFQVQQLPASTTAATICATQVGGNLQYTNNATPVVIAGSASCPGNTIAGNLQVQNNSARVTIGAASYGNTATGNIQVTGNTGGGTLSYNASTGGNCQLGSDTPGIVGSHNTAAGKTNTCNGTA